MQALTYIKTATAARQGFAKPYLAYGQMLPPPAITSPMLTISWSFTGHGSGSAKFPAIQHSAWRAPEGSVGIVLTNISSQTISVSVPISFSRLGLSPNISYTVSLLDANSTSILLNQLTSDSAVTISVAPLQVELLEIAASQPLCYTLSKSANPAAGGSVTINTASNCTGGYASGTAISLTATPATNYVFSSWTGSGGTFSNSSSSSTTFTISGNAAVTANFTLGPPGAAELLWPSGSILAATPAYSWNAVHGSTWYYLWVNDASASPKIRQWYTAQQAGCASGTGTCSVSSPAVLAQGAAQWWIQTWNDNGYGPWSSGMAFTVSGGLPGATTLISPSGTASANSPVYVWNAVPNASWYYLWVNDASASPKIMQWYTAQQAGCASGTGTCSVSSPAVLAQGAAQWWIQTWNDNGYGPWSSGMAFTVSGGLPGTATLVSPSGAISTRSPMYTWNAVSNATWYYLWVNDSTGAKVTTWYAAAQAGCASGTGTCSVTPSVTLASGDAQWWIQTWNDNGYGPWSTGMAFIVP
jgi:hypothetical protein